MLASKSTQELQANKIAMIIYLLVQHINFKNKQNVFVKLLDQIAGAYFLYFNLLLLSSDVYSPFSKYRSPQISFKFCFTFSIIVTFVRKGSLQFLLQNLRSCIVFA